ncbi:MAG: hypothetical protein ACREQ1_02940 [Woeseiaceae bacterium]
MYANDTSPIDQGSPHRRPYAALAGLSLLLAGWCTSSLAAAHVDVIGNHAARDLQSLTVEVVDLSDVSDSAEASDGLTESAAPWLFLTPRVASILQDVFGDNDGSDAEAAAEAVEPAQADRAETASSPVAENVRPAQVAEPESPLYEHNAILPRFQRQMYRTDI